MSNASEYADSLHAEIIANCDAEAPFGWIEESSGLYTTDIEEAKENALDEASAFDFISDALDIEYIVNSQREVTDGRVYVTVGGPTAWIDTEKRALVVTWMSEPEVRNLPSSFIDPISDALSELWEMGA